MSGDEIKKVYEHGRSGRHEPHGLFRSLSLSAEEKAACEQAFAQGVIDRMQSGESAPTGGLGKKIAKGYERGTSGRDDAHGWFDSIFIWAR
jgi:hypothetical protein